MKVINIRIPDDTYDDLALEVKSRNYTNRATGTGLCATKSSVIRVALEEWLNKNSKKRLAYQEWVNKMASNPDNFPSLDDTDDQPPDDAETEE